MYVCMCAPLRLVISRWLACEHNQCQTLVSVLAPKGKITQVFTLPSGVYMVHKYG